jgi:hypothetical protein
VLLLRCNTVMVYPGYASADPKSGLKPGQLKPGQLGVFLNIRKLLRANGSTPTPNHKLGPAQRISPITGNNQPKRCFVSAATCAFRLLKVLK